MKKPEVLLFSLAPLLASVMGLITMPVTAWIFSAEDVGRLAIFQTVTSLFLLAGTFGLDQAYMREYFQVIDKNNLLKQCMFPGIFVLLLGGAVALFWRDGISEVVYRHHGGLPTILTIIAVIANVIFRFSTITLRMEGDGVKFFIAVVGSKVVQFAALLTIVITISERNANHLLGTASLSIVAAALVGAWGARVYWRQRNQRPNASKRTIQSLIRFGYPLALSGFTYWVLSSMAIYSLNRFSDLHEVAIYSVAVGVGGAASAFSTVLSTVFFPHIYSRFKEREDVSYLYKILRQALALAVGIFVAYGAFGWVLSEFLPSQYLGVNSILLCCLIQPLFIALADVSSLGIVLVRRTMLTLYVTAAAATITFGLCFLLVPDYGARGAALANAIGYLVFLVAKTEAANNVWHKLPRAALYSFSLGMLFVAALTAIAAPNRTFTIQFLWLLSMLAIFYWFRREWGEIIRSFARA